MNENPRGHHILSEAEETSAYNEIPDQTEQRGGATMKYQIRQRDSTVMIHKIFVTLDYMGKHLNSWYLYHCQSVKAQTSMRICAVLFKPLLAYTKYRSRGRLTTKFIRPLAPMDMTAWAFKGGLHARIQREGQRVRTP